MKSNLSMHNLIPLCYASILFRTTYHGFKLQLQATTLIASKIKQPCTSQNMSKIETRKETTTYPVICQ